MGQRSGGEKPCGWYSRKWERGQKLVAKKLCKCMLGALRKSGPKNVPRPGRGALRGLGWTFLPGERLPVSVQLFLPQPEWRLQGEVSASVRVRERFLRTRARLSLVKGFAMWGRHERQRSIRECTLVQFYFMLDYFFSKALSNSPSVRFSSVGCFSLLWIQPLRASPQIVTW